MRAILSLGPKKRKLVIRGVRFKSSRFEQGLFIGIDIAFLARSSTTGGSSNMLEHGGGS